MRQAFAEGIGWGEAKQKLFERIDAELAEPRARYEGFMAQPGRIEEQLHAGQEKARVRSRALIEDLRWAVGVRSLNESMTSPSKKLGNTHDLAVPQFKSYRETDGNFYFKLHDFDGTLLFVSVPYASGRDAASEKNRLLIAAATREHRERRDDCNETEREAELHGEAGCILSIFWGATTRLS
jgi:tryptophanyl-tRNA synthetase